MPQTLICVYEVKTGKPQYMHSIDAAEAVNLGDYVYDMPHGEASDPKAMANAMAASRGMSSAVHPELMSPEEREATRAAANAVAARAAAVPVMMPPVMLATPMTAGLDVKAPVHEDPAAVHMPDVKTPAPEDPAHRGPAPMPKMSDKDTPMSGRKP